jgi:tRNA pseudouridine38-40 synthase
VQACIEECLSKIIGESIEIIGAGRTDTGVHASNYYAHVDITHEINCTDVQYKLNKMLSHDIVIYTIFKVNNEFHARFSALWRTYTYTLSLQKNPFLQETTWLYSYPLNIEAMNNAAALLQTYTDFTSFSKLHTDVNNNNCTITYAKWEQKGDLLIFTITANRFLRNMVRAITGTLIDVGRGKTSIPEFCTIIESKNRQNAGTSIPALGLCLVDIGYEWEHYKCK